MGEHKYSTDLDSGRTNISQTQAKKKIMKIFVLLSVFTCLALGFGQVVDIDIETIGADVSVMEYCEEKPSGHHFYMGCSALCTCGGDGSVGCVGRCPPSFIAPSPICTPVEVPDGPCCKKWVCQELLSGRRRRDSPLKRLLDGN